jgi:Zn-dependent protease
MTDAATAAALTCQECGTQVAPALLACPSCHRLRHAEELQRIASDAQRAEQAGDASAALALWRQVLDLLPPDAAQYQTVTTRLAELSRAVERTPTLTKTGSGWGKAATGLGATALVLMKFKFLLIFVATKAKLLLFGLTKMTTLFSMLLSAGVYWTAWGWKFALGVVLSIYVHEMGHVQALQRFGIKATAPMFIPGIGAVVRLNQYPATRREDARVGLAGPMWGLAAAAAAYAVYLATGAGIWAAIAQFGAWVNLFNLLPVWQLDGARGFRSLASRQRWIAVAAIGALWLVTAEGLLALLFVAGALAAWFGEPAEQPDNTALLQYASLVVVLSLMTRISVLSGLRV